MPGEFPAYVRILHPAQIDGTPVSWSEVAARSGRSMHRLAQFHAIAPSASGISSIQGISPPESGNLSPDLLKALCEMLAHHTNAQESCWLCLWEGYGWLRNSPVKPHLVFTASGLTSQDTGFPPVPSLSPSEILAGPKLRLASRNYYLLQGTLDAALDLGWALTAECFIPQSPNLFWPQDHAWCVASEIDLFCTLVAGSEALIDSLIADPRLEAWRVFAEEPITWNSDEINT